MRAEQPPYVLLMLAAIFCLLQLTGCLPDVAPPLQEEPLGINCEGVEFRFTGTFAQPSQPAPQSTLQQMGIAANQRMVFYKFGTGNAYIEGMGFFATGTWKPLPNGGAHFDFSSTNPGPNFNLTVKISFDATDTSQGHGTISNFTATFQPSVDTAPNPVNVSGASTTPGGQPAACFSPQTAADPVVLNSGEFILDPPADLSLGGSPLLHFRRHYGSLLKPNGIAGSMGDNWMHNFEATLVINNTQATVVLFGGASMLFNQSGSQWVLNKPQPLAYQLVQSGATYQFLDAGANLIYTFSSGGALTGIADRNGNALTITRSAAGPTQISDGLGRTLTLTYSPAGNLVSVKDQTGRGVAFGYTGGLLSSATDAAGKVTSYTYTGANAPSLRTALLTLIKRPIGNMVLTQTYDAEGSLVRQADALTNAATFVYDTPADGTGTVTDPLGDKTQAQHSDLRNVSELIDANNKVTTYVYDAGNHRTQITDRLGNKTLIAYDSASGLPTSTTDASGAVTSNVYTPQTQGGFTFYVLARRTFPDGAAVSGSYDANGNVLRVTDQTGKVTQYTYNKRGQVLTSTNPLGGVTTYTYNDDGTEASVTSPANNTTAYAYDALKRRVKTTRPDGSVLTVTYDALDRAVQRVFPSGAMQAFVFDDNGNLKSRTDISGATTTYAYDADDRRISVTTAAGTRSVTYDAVGNVITTSDEAGEKTSASYDPVGRRLTLADAAGNGFRFTWNAEGFPQSITDALSKTTALATDALGRVLTVTTPVGLKSSVAYDKLGRPISYTSPAGHALTLAYSARAELTQASIPNDISASFAYDDLGDLTAITDPNGGVWSQTFDSMGRQTGVTDPLSQTTAVRYDSLNRPNQVSGPGGTATLTHDALGNLTRAQFSDGTDLMYQYTVGRLTGAGGLSLAWNAARQIVSSNGVDTARDGAGRITGISYGPGLTVTYRYNNVGDLAEIDDWLGGATLFQHDAAHHLTSVQRPNGVITAWTYDADGRILTKTVTAADGTYAFSLQRDADGNVISADRSLPQLPQPAAGFNGYSFDAAHQLAGASSDPSGRLLSDGLRNYTWDMAGRLTSYSGVDGAAQFAYDGLGLMISRITADGKTDYVWNYAHPLPALAIVRSGGADVRYYICLPSGSPIYSVEAADNSRHYFHFDETGSTAFLTDDTGSVSDTYGITPFGESVSHTGAADNPFTFHGAYGVMQEGATSLYYMRARWYDSAPARFLSRDPVHLLHPLRIDPYEFALENPVTFADPSGLVGQAQGSNYTVTPRLQPTISMRYDLPSGTMTHAANPAPDPGEPIAIGPLPTVVLPRPQTPGPPPEGVHVVYTDFLSAMAALMGYVPTDLDRFEGGGPGPPSNVGTLEAPPFTGDVIKIVGTDDIRDVM